MSPSKKHPRKKSPAKKATRPTKGAGSKKSFQKCALSYADQLSLLKARGLAIADEKRCLWDLESISYYRLSGYWYPFQKPDGSHDFKPGHDWNEVMNLYEFDRALRLLLIDAIERVEIAVRAIWVYHLSTQYGAHAHLRPSLFRDKRDQNNKVVWSHTRGKNNIANEVKRSNEEFVRHFKDNYTEALPPLWASSELMSLGSLSKWFEGTKDRSVRQPTASAFGLPEQVLASFLHHLTVVRNHCAHHGRVWNRNMTIAFEQPKSKPQDLSQSLEPKNNKKLYNTLTMLLHLLGVIAPHNQWGNRLVTLIKEHGIDVRPMGFPIDYHLTPIWGGIK